MNSGAQYWLHHFDFLSAKIDESGNANIVSAEPKQHALCKQQCHLTMFGVDDKRASETGRAINDRSDEWQAHVGKRREDKENTHRGELCAQCTKAEDIEL